MDLFYKKNIIHQYKPEVILGLYAESGVRKLIDILPNIHTEDPALISWMEYFKSVGSAFIVVKKTGGFCAVWKERRV